jgi:hypothetical protein
MSIYFLFFDRILVSFSWKTRVERHQIDHNKNSSRPNLSGGFFLNLYKPYHESKACACLHFLGDWVLSVAADAPG